MTSFIEMSTVRKIFISLACVSAFACKHSMTNDTSIFYYNQTSGITSLDPAFATVQSNIWAVNQLYNGLVQLDSNLSIIPCIAKSEEISEDGLHYQFHLRNDVFFHDDSCFKDDKGRKVTAQDFAYSFHRIIDPKVASPGAWIFNGKVDSLNGFVALNDSTFQINLLRPYPVLLHILTMPYCFVIPAEALHYYGSNFRTHPVGTGPFQFSFWKEDVALQFKKNKNYFEYDENGNRLPYLDGVRISFVNNKITEFLEFRQHELDMLSDLDPSLINEVLTKNGDLQSDYQSSMKLQKTPQLDTEYLGFNMDSTKPGPLKNLLIRRAIAYSIDKKTMLQYLRNNIGTPAWHGMVPPALHNYDAKKIFGYDFNPDSAKILLKEAGYEDGKNLASIVLHASSANEAMGNFIVYNLKNVGIPATIETGQAKALTQEMVKGTIDFFRASWIADYPDAESFLAPFYSKYQAPPNYTRYSNAVTDKLYEQSFNTTNDSLRNILYEEMDQQVMRDVPIIPLYYDEVMRLVQPNITGLSNNAMNLLDLKRVRKVNSE